jgi:hypothetical protein
MLAQQLAMAGSKSFSPITIQSGSKGVQAMQKERRAMQSNSRLKISWIRSFMGPSPNGKLLKIQDYFTCYMFYVLAKSQDLPSQFWQTFEDAQKTLR